MKTKKLGIFIPLEIIRNGELDWLNKILLTEIIELTKLKNGCTASNEYLSKFLQIEKSSIHRRIKFLVDNGYIICKNKYSGKKCIGRIIIHTGKLMVAYTNVMVAPATIMVAQETINGIVEDLPMVAQSDPRITVSSTRNTVSSTVSNTEELVRQEQIILKKFNLI